MVCKVFHAAGMALLAVFALLAPTSGRASRRNTRADRWSPRSISPEPVIRRVRVRITIKVVIH